MAVPKKKVSKTRTRRRHASYVTRRRKLLVNGLHLIACATCGEQKKMHFACMKCGTYGDRKVVDVEARAQRRITKIEA